MCVQCLDCGNTWTGPSYLGETHPATQCPNCQSYRTQVSPTVSDMGHDLTAMPDSTQDDMSGNPLQEGILAENGWKPMGKRDESFASVRNASDVPFETTGIALPGQHTVEESLPSTGLSDGVLGGLRDLGVFVNGEPLAQSTSPLKGSTVMLSHWDPGVVDLAQDVVRNGHVGPMYNWYMDKLAGNRVHIQIPNGISDNLHTALGSLKAWVENPYENGALRPYYNQYWKSIRPAFSRPGAIRIGVSDPTMAEIINHVAQTDDLTPLKEFQKTRIAAPAAALAAPALEALGLGAGGAAAGGGLASAGGIGGLMGGAMSLGRGFSGVSGLAGMMGLGGGQQQDSYGTLPDQGQAVFSPGYYARTAGDDAIETPTSHDEIPKEEDGDSNQKSDGDNSEWQKDYADLGGGSLGFNPAGAGLQRLMMLAPLVLHYFDSDEDGSHDPLLKGLDESLEQELPGYKDHGDPDAAQQLFLILKGNDQEEDQKDEHEPGNDVPDTGDDDDGNGANHGGMHAASVDEDLADFLPRISIVAPGIPGLSAPINNQDLSRPMNGLNLEQSPAVQSRCPQCGATTDPSMTVCPQCHGSLQGASQHGAQGGSAPIAPGNRVAHDPYGTPQGFVPGPISPEEEALQSSSWPEAQGAVECPTCGSITSPQLGMCPHCGSELFSNAMEQQQAVYARTAGVGPHTPEQISAVQQLLIQEGRIDEIPLVPVQPEQFVEELSKITGRDGVNPEDDSLSPAPPPPAQEEAPPGATMPMPGMDTGQQMMAAVRRYAADSVAPKCPKCKSHTTGVLGEDHLKCHTCKHVWKSGDVIKTAEADHGHHDPTAEGNTIGVPAADQIRQEDHRAEQDSSHTWVDDQGLPLKVGEQYEMHSQKYDIPDLIRVDQVKPEAITYTLTGEYGLEHSTEITKEEADLEGLSFSPATQYDETELQPEQDSNNTPYEGSPETSDLSQPDTHQFGLTANNRSWLMKGVQPEQSHEDPNDHKSWLMQGVTAGAKFTPMEQNEFITESGIARNADKLNLAGTHYDDADDEQFLFGL